MLKISIKCRYFKHLATVNITLYLHSCKYLYNNKCQYFRHFMDLSKKLLSSSLSEAEVKVYLAALELGETLPTTLAKKANIKRPTLYELFPKLLEKGLLAEKIKGKRKYLVAQDIQPYLNERQKELEKAQEAIPALRALLATASSKPAILFYEGVEGIKKVYYDHLLVREEVFELVGIENIHPELQKYIINYYIPERIRRKIPLKMIVNGSINVDPFRVRSSIRELREVKVFGKNTLSTPLGLDIYGDNISITLHRKDSEMIGIIIRSSEIAETLRSLFQFLWASAEES
jgi:HTH-type transcriptional regulator, sugar sensing transcriptional regulator